MTRFSKACWLLNLAAWGLFFHGGLLQGAEDSSSAKEIHWQAWSTSVFDQAKREHKFVLLDLQAVWCHWCHVIDAKTYSDPHVIALIQAHYIAIRVDQDAHPDLATRYQDYGWPATIVFNNDGSEIVKRQGYLPPLLMASILQAIIDDPSPGPSVTQEAAVVLSNKPGMLDADHLRHQFEIGYDWKLGSWGGDQKFLNWDNVENCLRQAQFGNANAEKMARQALTAQLQLIDPVWGGVDQYSSEGDWSHPHFEKIMQFQAENIRIYSEAYAQWKDPVDLKTAEGIYAYVREFLTSTDGVVYASQDADLVPGQHAADYFKLNDTERRKLGIPRVDRHIYARENGWFIQALTALYQVTDDVRYRNEAIAAAKWIIANRSVAGGGFRHGEEKTDSLNLGDNLAMGRAFLSLYTVTANHRWLDTAQQTADFIAANFAFTVEGKPMGFAATGGKSDAGLFTPKPDFDENVSLARFANLLFHYTGNSHDQEMADTALRHSGNADVARKQLSSVGALLLAEEESNSDPLHIVIVGAKTDPLAKSLFEASIAFPFSYKQVEWISDHQSGAGAEAIQYPNLPTSAAYVCAHGACSSPVVQVKDLSDLLQRKISKEDQAAH